jgi:endoglucanase
MRSQGAILAERSRPGWDDAARAAAILRRDDLELGATELAVALASGGPLPGGLAHARSSFYLEQAARWAKAYISDSGASSETLNLYDVSGLAHFELVRALREAGNPPGVAVAEAQLIANLRHQLDAAVAQSQSDPFGFGFPWNTADTASPGPLSARV